MQPSEEPRPDATSGAAYEVTAPDSDTTRSRRRPVELEVTAREDPDDITKQQREPWVTRYRTCQGTHRGSCSRACQPGRQPEPPGGRSNEAPSRPAGTEPSIGERASIGDERCGVIRCCGLHGGRLPLYESTPFRL